MEAYSRREYMRQMLNLGRVVNPTPLSARVASHSAVMFAVLSVPFCIMTQMTSWHSRLGLVFMGLKLTTCLVVMARQPADVSGLTFHVPAGYKKILDFIIIPLNPLFSFKQVLRNEFGSVTSRQKL